MKQRKLILIFTSLALSSMLSACGISMKPEHPQVYDNFKDRRPPIENKLMNEGTYINQPEPSSHFSPYTGPRSDRAVQSGNTNTAPAPNLNSSTAIPPSAGNTPAPSAAGATNGAAQSATTSSDQAPFWDRLKQKLSNNNTISTPGEITQLARKQPKENYIELASNNLKDSEEYFLGQGSRNETSYYDQAIEVPSALLINHNIQQSPILLAANTNASAPLVNIPQVDSYDEIKQEAQSENLPELKNVPQNSVIPKPLNVIQKSVVTDEISNANIVDIEPVTMTENSDVTATKTVKIINKESRVNKKANTSKILSKTKSSKLNSKHAIVSSNEDDIDVGKYTIKDKNAQIVYQNGRPMVMGSMGSLR